MALESLKDLYVETLQDLYSAETQILEALPKMIEKSSHSQLKSGFSTHLQQTHQQARRLEQIAQQLGVDAKGKKCKGMEGLIKEGQEAIQEDADESVRDAALIGAAQRVEHYEIAGYGCARTYTEALGRDEDARLLQQTLDEEADTDKKLTQVAVTIVNPDAQQRSRAGRDVSSASRSERGNPRPDSEARF